MAEERTLGYQDKFFESTDRDSNRPLELLKGQELRVERASRRGGPHGTAIGWRIVKGSRAAVMRIGTGRKFTFPPEGTTPIIFLKGKK